jgi:hypothetical protein
MKTSRAFMTAVPLALLLVAVLATLVAVTPGAFRFDSWPDAPKRALSEREVVVDVPVSGTGGARADARRTPAVQGEGTTLVGRDPSEPLERRDVPVAAPEAPQVVADSGPRTEREPESGGDGATSTPVGAEPEAGDAEPLEPQSQEPPALPGIPAKDLPVDPDPVLPQLDADRPVRPRNPEDDQE